MPSVTVLMPVYNGARYLRTAIESILAQTYADFEFLIINDGSTDSSREIITSYRDARIRLVDNDHNLGLTRTLNRGLQLTEGDLVARQDADDVSHYRRLEQQVQFLRHHPSVALLGTQGRVIDQDGNYQGPLDRSRDHASIRWYHFFSSGFIHGSVMFRREVIYNEFGGYRDFLYCEDYELWSRVALAYPVANLPARLVDYRNHSASIINSLRAERAEISRSGNRCIIGRNLEAVFGQQSFSVKEVELISRFRVGVDEASLRPFMKVFRRLLERYQMLFPEVRRSLNFWRTVAWQYDDLAYGVSTAKRNLALRVYAEGIRHNPVLVFLLPWPKVLALIVLGKTGRSIFRQLWSYRRIFSESWKRRRAYISRLHLEL